ncbi:hypothetical protein ACFCT7_02580 [Fulvivirgaceae bacterium LMO-SS25]
MESLKDFLPILLALLYFLISGLGSKKKKSQPNRRQPSRPTEDSPEVNTPSEKPLTFEELLRQISGETEEKREVEEELNSTVEEIEDDVYETVYGDREESKYADFSEVDVSQEKYSRLNDRVKIEEEIERKRILEVIDLEEDQKGSSSKIKEMLQSPEGARDAIILSEIIRPKYF